MNGKSVSLAVGALLAAVLLAGCAPAASSSSDRAAAKAEEWRSAAYGDSQKALDDLYCEGKAAWDVSKVKGWQGDKNSKFDKPTISDADTHVFDVVLKNPEWPRPTVIHVRISDGSACVDSVSSPDS